MGIKRHNINLIKTIDNNSYIDYDLYENNIKVGLLQTIEDNNRDYIFGRQIEVNEKYQGDGIGTSVIDDFVMNHDKPFRFCIATNSDKAVDFWQLYLKATKFNKKNIRGHIWEVWK